MPKLWQYNLHYFEWLWALDYESVRTIILDWILRHPLDKDKVGWESYPISLRLMNWCGVCYDKYRAEVKSDQAFSEALWRSLFLQAQWLTKHIETHLLGNHLLENGAALAFVGSCFSGPDAKQWLETGVSILEQEIPEQILPDGMHFERSPMYHLRVTYLLRLLKSTQNETLKRLVESPMPKMEGALAKLCHPDDQIALFNDSAFSVYNEPTELMKTATRAPSGPWALPNAGYYGWRGTDGSYVICDAGPIGPDYLPGHAHGDIFSFELSLKGQRVIVDSGVYDYIPGEMRDYCRSTRAHNTVEINGKGQCEFWGAFRVARRGYPRDVQWEPTPDGFRLSGWHDGYQRLSGAPAHHRTIAWSAPNRLEVCDRVEARHIVNAISRLHLHPCCRIIERGRHDVLVEFTDGTFLITFTGDGKLSCEDSFYCPEFGRKEPNVALAFTMDGKETEVRYTIASH